MAGLVTAILALAATAAPAGNDLRGLVTSQGRPVAGATVYVYTAAPRIGTSPHSPDSYPDCGKRATTDAGGAFLIPSLDAQLVFRILVVADGFEPVFVTNVDPAVGEMRAELKPRRMAVDLHHAVRGNVIDADGKAVVGATVTPFGMRKGDRRWWGDTSGEVDSLSITNERGEFFLVTKEADVQVDVEVRARGLATGKFPLLRTGFRSHVLRLSRGAMVTGRLLHEDRPMPGVAMGLVQASRLEDFVGDMTIGTDDDGRFTFMNVKPDETCFVYAKMDSLASSGLAVPATAVKTPGDGETIDIGVLEARPGHRISGIVQLSDGKSVPRSTRLLLSREQAADSTIVPVAADGAFEITAVPEEEVSLSVRVRGYHLSEQNACLDPVNWTLVGQVPRDLPGLVILLEAGEADSQTFRRKPQSEQMELRARFEEARRGELRGAEKKPAAPAPRAPAVPRRRGG